MSSVIIPTPGPLPGPLPPPVTAVEFARLYASRRAELVKGVVKELPMPWPKHGKICAEVTWLLRNYIEQHRNGHVMSNDSFVQTRSNPDSVRGPDVCYYSYARLPQGAVPEGILPVAPDLVVEVRSPSDTWTEMFAKVAEYLGAGVRAVIVLDAATQTASVYRGDALQQTFEASQELTVPEVLPGFTVMVQRLFE